VSASRGRSLRVDPERVVELAGRCDDAVEAVVLQWAEAGAELWAACDRLGDSASVTGVAAAYAGSLAAADEVVGALVHALDGGIAALVDSARDVAEADETVAFEIGRSAGGRGRHRGWDGSDGPGRGR
jgi:hypothetical protein